MKALVESTSSLSFTSNEDIMKSRRLITKDVFGASIDDVDIWMETPEQSQKPKFSMKVEQRRKSSSSKQTREEFDEKKNTSKSTKPKDERRKSKSKRSSTSGSTNRRKERATDPAEEKLAPVMAPLVSATDTFPKTRTSRPKQPLHQERNEEPLLSEDSVDFLMQRLKNERVTQPQEAQKHKTHQKHKTAESGISVEPKRFTAAALRGEEAASRNKKKANTSYLPRTSASSSENRQARQESVSASLNRFLADSASSDLPPKSDLRSVYSSPEKSKTKKVRPSRRTTMRTLGSHLQSTRPRRSQGGAHRSVASAQRSVASAPAVASRTKDLRTKCQALKLAF